MPSMVILKGVRVAAHWNDEATLLIQQRDYSNAAAALSTALVTLREALNTSSSISSSSSSSSCCMDPPPLVSSTTMSIHSSTSNDEHNQEGTNSMMMDMETSSSSSSTTTTTTTTTTSSLLTFLTCCNKPEQESQERMDNVCSPLPSSSNTTLGSSARQMMMIAVEEDWYLCHAPLQVTSSEALVSSPRCVEILSYSIIYNLGLCYHLAALSSTSTVVSSSSSSPISTLSTSQQLQRAVSFYHHAQRLLACARSFNHPYINVPMHTMVLTNNMGHAYYVLNEELVAKQCFQTLLIAIFQYQSMSLSSLSLSWRQESLQGQQPHDDQEVPILECFLSNSMHFLIFGMGGKPVAAPAA